ncbi:2-dehydropantoate 2-reductase [Vibrio sp. FNV 38]|nr:2-dehydropantoate 2-reductase [Vibrio sp. FNV 38]
MNITIVGPGAVGCLWAYHLATRGHHVSLWGRETRTEKQIQLDQQPGMTLAYNQTLELQNSDLVLVTVKAWQVEEALNPLAAEIHSDCIVMLMHNGMGTADWLLERFPNNPLLLATTTHGALRLSDAIISHTGKGVSHIGALNPKGKQCQFIEAVFAHCLPDVNWCEDIHQALWNKLAINCAINPMTAKYAIRNGELAQDIYQHELIQVVGEVQQVMQAEGILISLESLQEKVDTVVRLTANNWSSMQQDIEHRRHSEIDFISGYLLDRAQAHQLELPYNQALYNHILHVEQSFD